MPYLKDFSSDCPYHVLQTLGYPHPASPVDCVHGDGDHLPQVGELAVPESGPLGVTVSCVGRTIGRNQNQGVPW